MVTYFLIPIYNECENIEALHRNISCVLTDRKRFFIFVDDGSSDASVSMLKKYFGAFPHHIIEKDRNYGPGDSFNRGFLWVLEHSSDRNDKIVTLEADNTSDIHILPRMMAISELGYELVLASIYAQGGGFYRTCLFRKVISFLANMLFRSILNVRVLTISSFYRIYHIGLLRRILDKYDDLITEKGFICMLEILIKSIHVHASIIEVPMILKSTNRKGKSKMKIIKTSTSYLRFLLFGNK